MSKKFPEYKKFDLSQINLEINAFWKENRIFEKSVTIREGRPTFVFNEGPPSANGKPGIHHVMARTIKDIFCRYKTQQGYQVKRKAGWDTHRDKNLHCRFQRSLPYRCDEVHQHVGGAHRIHGLLDQHG